MLSSLRPPDKCHHCHGKMSAPKPVAEGPHKGQMKRICFNCGHVQYEQGGQPPPGQAQAQQPPLH